MKTTQEVPAPKRRSRRDVSFPPLTPEQQALAAEAMPRALRIVRGHDLGGPAEDNRRSDIESDATYAAVRAAGKHNLSEREWPAWSSMWINHACKYRYRTKWYRRRKFVDFVLGGVARNITEVVPDPKPGPAEQVASADAFEAMMALLTPWESAVVRLIYVTGLNNIEVADRVGVDVHLVGKLHCSAIERLRGLMGGHRRHECA